MSSIILELEQSYSSICAEITDTTSKVKNATSKQDVDTLSIKLESLFNDAKETLEQVELECHSLDNKSKEKVEIRLSSYRTELGRQQKQFQACKTEANQRMDRLELLDRSGEYDSSVHIDFETDAILASSSKQLDDGRRLLAETEEIGASVLGDLASQRETIQKSRNRLKDVEGGLGDSNTLLNSMLFRARQNKIVLGAVTIIIIVVIIWVFYHLVSN